MKTLVFQSLRPFEVPAWIERCVRSVEQWAAAQGYSYVRIGDELFDMVPDWFRAKSTASLLPATDLGRLQWCARFLREEWERVIWFDADVLVFNPALRIESNSPELCCREAWVKRKPSHPLRASKKINNSVMAYTRESAFLEFYIESCLRIVREEPGEIKRNALGPIFLTAIRHAAPLHTIEGVATFSPDLLQDLTEGRQNCIQLHARVWQGEVHAANLCSSVNTPDKADMMHRVVTLLLESRGSIVNPEPGEISEPFEIVTRRGKRREFQD